MSAYVCICGLIERRRGNGGYNLILVTTAQCSDNQLCKKVKNLREERTWDELPTSILTLMIFSVSWRGSITTLIMYWFFHAGAGINPLTAQIVSPWDIGFDVDLDIDLNPDRIMRLRLHCDFNRV